MKQVEYYVGCAFYVNRRLGVRSLCGRMCTFNGKKGKKEMSKRLREIVNICREFPLYSDDKFFFRVKKHRMRYE